MSKDSKLSYDDMIDLSKYTHCKIFAEHELIMFTETKPSFDLGKRKISFSRVAIKDCFYGKYLGTDFTIELYESDVEKEASVTFHESGIMNFGLLNLVENEAGRFVTADNIEFEFDWMYDSKDRFSSLLEKAQEEEFKRIEEEEKMREEEIKVGDTVKFYDDYHQIDRRGTVKKIWSENSVEVEVFTDSDSYSMTKYRKIKDLIKIKKVI